MHTVEFVLWVFATYLSVGVMVGLTFVTVGVDRVDSAARGASGMFRLLILPGSVALWPLVIMRMIQAMKGRPS